MPDVRGERSTSKVRISSGWSTSQKELQPSRSPNISTQPSDAASFLLASVATPYPANACVISNQPMSAPLRISGHSGPNLAPEKILRKRGGGALVILDYAPAWFTMEGKARFAISPSQGGCPRELAGRQGMRKLHWAAPGRKDCHACALSEEERKYCHQQ